MGPMCQRGPRRPKAVAPDVRKCVPVGRRWKGQYREAKGVRLFLVDEDRIVHLLSWHQIQTDEELGQALEKIHQAGLIPEDQIRLCAIADGAPWIWKLVERLFPSARQILDFYHCSSYLHAVAKTQ